MICITHRVLIRSEALAKSFMNTHLHRMSIRDYFKHLYLYVIENLKLGES